MLFFSLIISHAKLLHQSPGRKLKIWKKISHNALKACCKIFLQHFLQMRQSRQEETHWAAKPKLWCYGPPQKNNTDVQSYYVYKTHTHPADLCTWKRVPCLHPANSQMVGLIFFGMLLTGLILLILNASSFTKRWSRGIIIEVCRELILLKNKNKKNSKTNIGEKKNPAK